MEHIRTMYNLDQKNDIRLVPKLRDHHINPSNAQKMKVKIASQLLSRTVSAGKSNHISWDN